LQCVAVCCSGLSMEFCALRVELLLKTDSLSGYPEGTGEFFLSFLLQWCIYRLLQCVAVVYVWCVVVCCGVLQVYRVLSRTMFYPTGSFPKSKHLQRYRTSVEKKRN